MFVKSLAEGDLAGVAPSSARVSISEETITKDVDVCEESEIDVDVPVVVPSDALVPISEEITTEDVDVCEESENVVGIPDAVSSALLVPVSGETSMDVDVCEKLETEVDISVVAEFDSIENNPGKDAVPSEPIKSLILNRELVCDRPRSGSRSMLFKLELDQRTVQT